MGEGDMGEKTLYAVNVAEAYLALLAERGVAYLFGNAGTDFAPIVEAFADAKARALPTPAPVLAAHENLAVSMAHGYAMVSGRVPAVMVHVSVGTANAMCGLFNAARENVPMLLTAGRTPLTEAGLPGARDAYIHWGQEMYDQAAMLRELVKWDYELRNGAQLEVVLDRALALAATEPRGPVYLSLPREVLAAPLGELRYRQPSRLAAAAPPAADEGALSEAAAILSAAENPLIVTTSAGRDPAAVSALAALAERAAIPVVQFAPRHLSLPADHPMQLGFDPSPLIADADVVLAIESDVPWMPSRAAPPPEAKVVQIGLDPLFGKYPIRGFPSDLAITARAAQALP
ncbi:MAG: thiamine pyrophosphate-binding protein, partial [Acetobacteraceae bacterium]